MTGYPASFLLVLDTNVIVSSQKGSSNSPNREILTRWKNREFDILFSRDVIYEYYKKLKQFDISPEIIEELIYRIRKTACEVEVEFFHLEKYPTDPDDIAFLLCADNGQATHLVTYDTCLLELDGFYKFKICQPLPFLHELRKNVRKASPHTG